jgi:uncharacterized protein YjbI with pentapeptide repeats
MEFLVARTLADEIGKQSPRVFRHVTLTDAIADWLLELKPQPVKPWRDVLWAWIRNTVDKEADTAGYYGGNALSILRQMKEPFIGVDLSKAKIRGAKLNKANLSGAKLEETDLRSINLEGAKLDNANFKGAVMSGANLSGANLYNADFRGANLSRANLTGSNITDAVFCGADLTSATAYNVTIQGKSMEGSRILELAKTSPLFKDAVLTGMSVSRPIRRGCFATGTQIAMADGSTRSIESIKKGDRIVTLDLETRQLIENLVSDIFMEESSSRVVINRSLRTTPSESLYNGTMWVTPAEIHVGDSLYTMGGKVKVSAIEYIEKAMTVYNLETLPNHSFFADGYLVHNKRSRSHD